LKTHFENLKNW